MSCSRPIFNACFFIQEDLNFLKLTIKDYEKVSKIDYKITLYENEVYTYSSGLNSETLEIPLPNLDIEKYKHELVLTIEGRKYIAFLGEVKIVAKNDNTCCGLSSSSDANIEVNTNEVNIDLSISTNGLQGIQGEKGERGEKGEQGPQGIQGEAGEQGEKGDSFIISFDINENMELTMDSTKDDLNFKVENGNLILEV